MSEPMRTVSAEAPKSRTPKLFDPKVLFGLDLGTQQVAGYADRTEHVPEFDPGYVFLPNETKAVLLGLHCRDNILLVGDTGTGKTSLLEQVAARLNYQVVKISFDGHVTRQDLVGEWVVKGRNMTFVHGLLVFGMRSEGTIIILDEWDTIGGDCSFVLQRPLQRDDRKLVVLENAGEIVHMHAKNVFAATANTCGQGDDSGLYSHGTKVQNYAQINRFSLTVRMPHPSSEQEMEILRHRFPELAEVERKALTQAVQALRDGYHNGQLSTPVSTRDLINWAEKFLKTGDPERAAGLAFVNRQVDRDITVANGIIKRVFGAKV